MEQQRREEARKCREEMMDRRTRSPSPASPSSPPTTARPRSPGLWGTITGWLGTAWDMLYGTGTSTMPGGSASGGEAAPHIAQRWLLSKMQERVNNLKERGANREFIAYAEGELEAARTGQLKEFHEKNPPPKGFQPFMGGAN